MTLAPSATTGSPRPSALRAARGAMVVQTLFAAGTFLVTKDALGSPGHEGPVTTGALFTLRLAATAILLGALLALARRHGALPRVRVPAIVGLGLLAVPLNVGLFFEGASRAPAAHAALFYALTPVLVFGLERIRGNAVATPARILGLLLALSGAVVVLARRGAFEGPEPVGDLMLLGAAFSWALYTCYSRPLVATVGAFPTMAWTLLVGCLVGLPLGWLRAPLPDVAALPLRVWGAVAYLAVITSVTSYWLWLFALKRLDATQVAVFTNLQPIATAVLAWLLLGERISLALLTATVLVLAGVSLVQRPVPR